jgi:hypothetical protein
MGRLRDHMNSSRLTAMTIMPAIISTIVACGMAAFSQARNTDPFTVSSGGTVRRPETAAGKPISAFRPGELPYR